MTKFANDRDEQRHDEGRAVREDAPKTVANFVRKARQLSFYDGTKFHRVIRISWYRGDPYSKGGEHAKGPVGTGGPGYQIDMRDPGKPAQAHVGALSMAHAGKKTGGSSFFIVLSEQNTKHLNGVHKFSER